MLFIFDMGGVVTNTFKFDRMYEKLGIDGDVFYKICSSESFDIKHALDIGEISVKEFWKFFNERSQKKEWSSFKIPLVKNDLFRMYFHPSKNLETIALINKLKSEGHRVICGTNTIDSHWENHMERGDYAFFNQTYASNKIGVAKPDPDFFRVILDAEGYKASETFFTDDKIENCKAAESLGINAFQFTNAMEYENFIKSVIVG